MKGSIFNQYWAAMIRNCNPAVFRVVNGYSDAFGNKHNYVFRVVPMAIELQKEADELHVYVERSTEARRYTNFDRYLGEHTVLVGSHESVCNQIVNKLQITGDIVLGRSFNWSNLLTY